MPLLAKAPAVQSLLRRQALSTGRSVAGGCRSCNRDISSLLSPSVPTGVRSSAASLTPTTIRAFSNMSSWRSNESGAVGGGRQYDQEIQDMASYIHNYKIDSDLAVCDLLLLGPIA